METLDKFPRTPHLIWLGPGVPRDDKVLSESERAAFLTGPVVVEEKVDGANLGIYVSQEGTLAVQNRGALLESGKTSPQFEPLWSWLALRRNKLISCLGSRYALFGEWCFAKHSVRYPSLPDWFLGFDVLERKGGFFWDTATRNDFFSAAGIVPVPCIAAGSYSEKGLGAMLDKADSRLGAIKPEGLYLRKEIDGVGPAQLSGLID